MNSTNRMVEWGHAYPYDLLGAWDYAQSIHPPLPPSMVGIWGVSLGAMTTLSAFGLEPKIPAIWIDDAPIDPRGGFALPFLDGALDLGVPEFLAQALVNSAVKAVERTALKGGFSINEHLPADLLPLGPDTRRPVFVTAIQADSTVDFVNSQMIVNLLKSYPMKYNLVDFWVPNWNCAGFTHAISMFPNPDLYASRMKAFWTNVFGGLPVDPCGTVAPWTTTPAASLCASTAASPCASTGIAP